MSSLHCSKSVFTVSHMEENSKFKTGMNSQIVKINGSLGLQIKFKEKFSWARDSPPRSLTESQPVDLTHYSSSIESGLSQGDKTKE